MNILFAYPQTIDICGVNIYTIDIIRLNSELLVSWAVKKSMQTKTACFTGHRTLPDENLPEIAERLENALIALIEQGYRYFGAGGALGFDTLAAQAVLRLRERHPQIRLILVLPCLNQTRGWLQENIDTYEEIKRCADKVTYTSEHYFRGCMQKRNRHLVDNSSVCICYLTKPTGGTAYTVDYARRRGLRIINIAGPDSL